MVHPYQRKTLIIHKCRIFPHQHFASVNSKKISIHNRPFDLSGVENNVNKTKGKFCVTKVNLRWDKFYPVEQDKQFVVCRSFSLLLFMPVVFISFKTRSDFYILLCSYPSILMSVFMFVCMSEMSFYSFSEHLFWPQTVCKKRNYPTINQ